MYESFLRFPADLFGEFDRLQREVDRMFGGLPANIRALGHQAFPALNMGSTGDSVEIVAFAPGLEAKSLDVSIDKGLLTITGERVNELPQESDKATVYANERFAGNFKRVVTLPDDVDPARVQANYTDGILRISVAKRESSKPRRIDIN